MSVIIGIDPHKASHMAVAIDDDERSLGVLEVAADRQQTVRLLAWAELLSAGRTWAIVNFPPDGHTLIIGTTDNEVFTWDTRVSSWAEQACTIAGRNLTPAEWRAAFGDSPYRETCSAA